MFRKFSRWVVLSLGLALIAWGGAAMWTGWGVVQVERGWSLFIAGAAALSGGAVTFALACVLARLDDILAGAAAGAAAGSSEPAADTIEADPPKAAKAAKAVTSTKPEWVPPPPPVAVAAEPASPPVPATPAPAAAAPNAASVYGKPAPKPAPAASAAFPPPPSPPAAPAQPAHAARTVKAAVEASVQPVAAKPPAPKVTEVDRYSAGDAVYVMFSDGSVEVRTTMGARRYASLAELQAQQAAGK